MSEKSTGLALEVFKLGADRCKTEDDLADYVQMLCIISAKVINGIKGKQFQKEFLTGAILDDEKILPIIKQ